MRLKPMSYSDNSQKRPFDCIYKDIKDLTGDLAQISCCVLVLAVARFLLLNGHCQTAQFCERDYAVARADI